MLPTLCRMFHLVTKQYLTVFNSIWFYLFCLFYLSHRVSEGKRYSEPLLFHLQSCFLTVLLIVESWDCSGFFFGYAVAVSSVQYNHVCAGQRIETASH